MLYPPQAPTGQDLLGALAKSRLDAVERLPAKVVDPTISPKDRVLTGAQVYANTPGAARPDYERWRQDKAVGTMSQTPMRPGISEKQARFLATPDDRIAQAKALGAGDDTHAANVAGWLHTYGQNAQPSAPIDVARFVRAVDDGVLDGPKNDRVRELAGKMLAGNLSDDGEAAELTSAVGGLGRALDAFGDDLSIGKNGRLVHVDVTGGEPNLRVHYDPDDMEPVSAPGALQALPGNWLTPAALDGKMSGSGMDLYVGGTGDATVIGDDLERIDAVYRKGFPAVKGKDGTPRWLSSRPVVLKNLNAVPQAADRNPTAVVDTHLSVYPGFLPYDSIVFEQDNPSPRLKSLGAVPLGRGSSNRPAVSPRPLTYDDMTDSRTAADRTNDTMWAIFDDAHKVKLGPRYTAIPVTSDHGHTGQLVFGISPAEASEVTSHFAYTNEGIASRHVDDIVDDVADEWTFNAKDGQRVDISVDPADAPLGVLRVNQPVNRWHLPLDERSRARAGGLADEIELHGGQNVVAYVSAPDVKGFERAREHVYSDGGAGYSVGRTVDPVLGDPNGLPVWVRHADALPARWVSVPSDAIDTTIEEMTAQRKGDKFVVDARGMDDIGAQVRQGHALAQRHGYDKVELLGDDGPIPLVAAR